jgi:CcmD family protein
MKSKKGILGFLLIGLMISWSSTVFGQEMGGEVEMADLMRSSGKIYVVVAVLTIVFVGIILYLMQIDRKVKQLEKKITEKK